MKLLNNNKLQYRCLRQLYKTAPFDLKGDWQIILEGKETFLSCLIIASRPKELDALLEDLTFQSLSSNCFEVCILNDGAGSALRQTAEKYQDKLNIVYKENSSPCRVLSDLRNGTLMMARGEYILFLDDDTRITQPGFLDLARNLFQNKGADILIPEARALYGLCKPKYDFLDRFSMTNRCCLYRRCVLEELRGFKKGLNTYEDIELSIRVMIRKFNIFQAQELIYFHPPLYFESMRKPLSIGQTIFQIKPQYSFLVWLFVYINALRFLPYGLIPNKICRQWSKISWGVALYPFTGKFYYY